MATLLVPMAVPSVAGAAISEDMYEAAPGNNTPEFARDITTALDAEGISGYFGEIMSLQGHNFHFVDDATATSDEDWIKLRVSEADFEAGVSYVIEAVATDPVVDPVVELYGPVSSYTQVVPTAPVDLPADAANPTLTATDPAARDESNDEGPYFSMLSSSVSFIPSAPGWYYVRIRPYYQYGGGGFGGGEGRYMLRMKTGQLSRLSGATRVDTAVAISKERFAPLGPISGGVVLATSSGFADALSGSTLAGVLACPILLTPRDTLPASVAAEIARLRTVGEQTVYILGGPSAVSTAVVDAVAATGATTERIAGATRTETARLVATKAAQLAESGSTRSTSSVAFLASSRNFPDALAASPMAVYNWAPVLLTPGDVLDPQVVTALQDASLGITDVVIVGGTTAISAHVQTQVEDILGSTQNVRRIAGTSRYHTARDFAVWATAVSTGADQVGTTANPAALDILTFERIGIASGANFPDALAGGVFCGLAGSPILLTESQKVSPYLLSDFWTTATSYYQVPPGADYWFADDRAIMRSYIFGGKAAVSDYVHILLDPFTGPAF